jgi:hypothetical protein
VCRTSSVIFLFDKIFQVQIPAKTEIKYLLEYSKQKIKQKEKELKKKKIEGDLPGRGLASRPNTSAPQPSPTYLFVVFNLGAEAARWSSAKHPIHRRRFDAPDEGRRS